MANDPLHEFRELTRTLTQLSGDGRARPSAEEIAAQLARLREGAATFSELGPVPAEWRTAEWLLACPSHPFARRFRRQRAAAWFKEIACRHPEAITSEVMPGLHAALFDVCAAVAEDVAFVLGLLGRPESREPLERFRALMADEPGWGPNLMACEWSLLRIADPSRVEPVRGTVDEPVLVVRRLGPDIVHLVQRGDALLLRNPETGAEQAVSPVEAHLFRGTSEDRLARYFSGIENLSESRPPSRLGAVATGLMDGLPLADVLVTLTDTTTVHMARSTVHGLLRPEGLLDLSTLVHCCVFYDFVLVDTIGIDMPDELSGVVVPVRPYEASAADPRWTIAVEREAALQRDPALREQLEKSWEDMLGRPVRIDFHSFDSITDSPGVTQYFPGGSTLGFFDPVDATGGDRGTNELDRAVSIQTFRYWINETVATTLGAAYNCTTLRYPVESIALARRSAYLTTADQLMSRVAPQYSGRLEQPAPTGYLSPVRVPNLLGIVLQNSSRREDIWKQIVALRKRFEPVRDVLREGRSKGEHDSEAFNRLMGRLFGKSAWDLPVDTAITLASTVASSTLPGNAPGAVAVKAMAVAKPAGFAKRVVDRILRPEVHVLRAFADDVALMNSEMGHIERLWGQNVDRGWLATAARISHGSAHEGRTFRQ